MAQISRRGFVQAGTGTAIASMMPGRYSRIEAQEAPAGAVAGERVRFASIGVGIQGSSLLRAAMTLT